jgi:hypothetical protein
MAHKTLTASETSPVESPVASSAHRARLATILHVQWALAIACAYLVLFGHESGDPQGLGPLVVVGFLVTNLVVGRLRPELATTPWFGVAVAGIDALLITTSLYVAGQLSIELVLLCLGILILAIAGLRIGPIALATLGLTAVYLGIVWFTGDDTLWRSSVLLRVPLLFTAAIVYAWLVELGSRTAPDAAAAAPSHTPALDDEVALQWQAIERCQAALRAGSLAEANAALREVAAQNQAMRMRRTED